MSNNYYRAIADKFNETGLKLCEVAIAYEVDSREDLELKPEEFELVCSYLYNYYVHSNTGSCELVEAFASCYNKHNFELTDLVNKTKSVDEIIGDYLCYYY